MRNSSQENLVNFLKNSFIDYIGTEDLNNNFIKNEYFIINEDQTDILNSILSQSNDKIAELPLVINCRNYSNFNEIVSIINEHEQLLDLYLKLNANGTFNFFENNSYIKYITLHINVENIDLSNCFKNCGVLNSVDIDATSGNILANNLFENCLLLENINISTCETINITSIDYSFSNCDNLHKISFSNNNIIESAVGLFYGSFKNVTPDLSNYFLKANTINDAFSNSFITETPNLKHWKFTNAERLFYNTNISVLNNDILPDGVENIREAFSECSALISVDGNWLPPNSSSTYQNYTLDSSILKQIKDWEDPVVKDGFMIPKSVQNMYGLFRNCTALKSVKNLKLSKGINDWTFQNCSSLQECEDVYLNETPNNIGVFDSTSQNENWKIWLPRFIENNDPYNYGSDSILESGITEVVKSLYIDDGFILINDSLIDNTYERRKEYKNIIDPDNKHTLKFFMHILIHDATYFGFNELKDATVYYRNS